MQQKSTRPPELRRIRVWASLPGMPRTRRLRIAPGYRTEAELCADLVTWARAGGAAVHPECSGWDIVLVAPSGEQIGVQAKLRGSTRLVAQALEGVRGNTGPDIVALAVPLYDAGLEAVARALDMTTLYGASIAPRGHADFAWWLRLARRRATTQRCWVPEVEVDLPCGVPSPRTLSPWKFGAAKLCAALRAGETTSRKEAGALGINIATWVQRGWVARVEGSRPARYALRTLVDGGKPLPDRDFPEVVAALGLPPLEPGC